MRGGVLFHLLGFLNSDIQKKTLLNKQKFIVLSCLIGLPE